MKYEYFDKLLDEDLSWRKLEISELFLLAKETNKESVMKSVLLLLYAHWEGYIKKNSKLYIKYVSAQNIKLMELSDNFKAISLKSHISKCIESKDNMTLSNELIFLSKFIEKSDRKFKISIKMNEVSDLASSSEDFDNEINEYDNEIIDTESNLKPKVFKNIIDILGLHYKIALQTREHYINSYLLKNRNAISHGSKFDVSQENFSLSIRDIEKLKEIIFSIIDNFRDELLDYAHNEFYLAVNSVRKKEFENRKERELEKVFAAIETNYKN